MGVVVCSFKGFVEAESRGVVDISYLVCDFKYSQVGGVKICEVQHGSLSALEGDRYICNGDGKIAPKIADYLAYLPMKKWAAGTLYPPLKRSLELRDWVIMRSGKMIFNDPGFLECARQTPAEPSLIASYQGIVYADSEIMRRPNFNFKGYPGIIIMNLVTFPFWKDKYKMNALFELNEKLNSYKAEWKLYPKKYDPQLSYQIKESMPAEFYVIKPRGEFLANGVIVVSESELDTVLKMILEPRDNLGNHPDKKYAYWKNNSDDSFIIEKYYASDLLSVSDSSNDRHFHYDATLRLAFILTYDHGQASYYSLGGFWKLPSKALEEEGSLNEKRISCCKPPFYQPIDPELFKEINPQMEKAMLLLYHLMLQQSCGECLY